jgi:transposase
MMGPL